MPFQISQATLEDLDTIAVLFDGYRQFYGQPADLPRARDFLAGRLSRNESIILLARDENSGIGLDFTQLYPLFSSVRMVRTWLLNDLFVAAAARRKGVAAALLQAAIRARELGAASLSLSTALDNAPAQALYESLGWQRDRQFCEYGLML
ncbi:MAG TPA: GNAT family N-acetyltransferase [Rhodanobacter sp.]